MAIGMRAGTVAVAAAVVFACREPGVLPPPPVTPLYSTLTIDRSVTLVDVVPSWTGVTLLPERNQSLNIVSMDYFGDRLRYAGCANVCDDSTHWLTTTISPAGESLYPNSGAALTSSGLHAVYMMSGPTIRHGYCPGACQIPANWQVGSLFHGYIGGKNGAVSVPMAADSSGRLHLIYFPSATPSGLRYAECVGICGDSAAWSSVQIDSSFPFLALALVTSSGGTNHLVYSVFPTLRLRYATCNAVCTDSTSWTAFDIDTLAVNGVALALAASGRLHVAYLVGDTVHYTTCTSNCTTAGAWQSVSLGKPSTAVAIADRDGVVYVATNEGHVTVWRCSTSCFSAAGWQSISVDSARGEGFLAFAFDSVGHAVVASTSTSLQLTHLTQ